jgi:hypothetical protein
MRKSFAALVLLLSFIATSLFAFAQAGDTIQGGRVKSGPYTPERSAPERKAILDALHVPIEKQLKQSSSLR